LRFQRRIRYIRINLEEYKVILIFRIICKNNLKERRRTGKPLQYTLTILPGFLIPYSRIPVDCVFKAIDYYVTSSRSNLLEAAFLMNCVNISSFGLYYFRFLALVDEWILFIIQITIAIGGDNRQEEIKEIEVEEEAKIKHKWCRFKKCKKEYFYLHSVIPGNVIITESFQNQYLHVIFCGNKMGLGP
jgi:hypothetical protein